MYRFETGPPYYVFDKYGDHVFNSVDEWHAYIANRVSEIQGGNWIVTNLDKLSNTITIKEDE